jgi:hypothetical protein
VIAGLTSADFVQRTLIPLADAVATTFVGADGAEYVLADAIGVTVEIARAANATVAPQKARGRVRVLFIRRILLGLWAQSCCDTVKAG